MAGHSTYVPKTAIERWLDSRLPIVRLMYDAAIDYPTPRNLNYWWTFGAMLTVVLVGQIVTGVILAMHYVPHVDHAFASVERIMRDVNYGWLIRYIHSNGASMFFLACYIHMLRGLYYGSYKAPREVIWLLGSVLFLLLIMTAFLGYVLPWGQMSFHGAVVITNLLGAVPVVGESITTWLWGGFAVDNPTLNRFFALHYLLPFIIAGVVILQANPPPKGEPGTPGENGQAGQPGADGQPGRDGKDAPPPTDEQIQGAFVAYVQAHPDFLPSQLCANYGQNFNRAQDLVAQDGTRYTLYGCITQVVPPVPTSENPPTTTEETPPPTATTGG